MKAVAVFPRTREIRLVDHAPPRLQRPTDVRIRILDVGVCGTDREIAAFAYGTPPTGSEYLVIGHESVGEVVEVGSAAKDLDPGDLVVPMVRRPCHHSDCRACAANEQDFCYTGDFTERGIKGAHGFMTEFVVDDAAYMWRVPRQFRDVAVLIEPLTIAEKALAQLWEVQRRLPWSCRHGGPIEAPAGDCHRAVVLGAGPVGLLGAMAFAAQGFDTFIYSRSSNATILSIASAIGAAFLSAEEYSVDDLTRAVGRIDVVYEAVGASQLAFEVIPHLAANAVFIFTGVPGRKAPISIDGDRIMRNLVLNNQVLLGTVNAGHDAFAAAVCDLGLFMARWPDAVRRLITGRFKPEEHLKLLAGNRKGIKNVMSFAS